MKLKEFNAVNSKSTRKGEATVSFSSKTGVVTISKEAARVLGIDGTSMVTILQDTASPKDWYIKKVSENGFTLRLTAGKGGALLFNCSAICKAVQYSLNVSASVKCPLANEPVDGQEGLFALITRFVSPR